MNILCRLVRAVLGWLNDPLPPDEFIDIPPDTAKTVIDHPVFYVGVGPANGERRRADDD